MGSILGDLIVFFAQSPALATADKVTTLFIKCSSLPQFFQLVVPDVIAHDAGRTAVHSAFSSHRVNREKQGQTQESFLAMCAPSCDTHHLLSWLCHVNYPASEIPKLQDRRRSHLRRRRIHRVSCRVGRKTSASTITRNSSSAYLLCLRPETRQPGMFAKARNRRRLLSSYSDKLFQAVKVSI